MRRCTSCRREKSESEFYQMGGAFKGLRSKCKMCIKTEGRARYLRGNVILRRLQMRLRVYGLSIVEWDQMWSAQNGLCACCGVRMVSIQTAPEQGNLKAPAVDHCHRGGQVRALLCRACNSMLGYARDNPAILEAGARYLRKHAKKLAEGLPLFAVEM